MATNKNITENKEFEVMSDVCPSVDHMATVLRAFLFRPSSQAEEGGVDGTSLHKMRSWPEVP
jgi:hypothetical protein